MSHDIRKYFEVGTQNACNHVFKNYITNTNSNIPKTCEMKTDLAKTFSKKIVEAQPLSCNQINEKNQINENLITYEAFTDGSTLGNGARNANGGIGVYFSGDHKLDNVSLNYAKFVIENPMLSMQKATNNITELLAISIAIQLITQNYKTKYDTDSLENLRIIIYSDSEYSINCITKWAAGWEKNGWQKRGGKKADREIKNLELIKKLYQTFKNQRIKFVHVNSHTREPVNKNSVEWKIWHGNEMADRLAKKGALAS